MKILGQGTDTWNETLNSSESSWLASAINQVGIEKLRELSARENLRARQEGFTFYTYGKYRPTPPRYNPKDTFNGDIPQGKVLYREQVEGTQ